jgi:hypothetical protein
MKYILTESKINNMIKDYILKNYDVADVEFGDKRVQLGSGPNEKGESIIDRKVISVTIDNINKKMTISELKEISREIYRHLTTMFNIKSFEYGSEWEIKFYQLKKVEVEI